MTQTIFIILICLLGAIPAYAEVWDDLKRCEEIYKRSDFPEAIACLQQICPQGDAEACIAAQRYVGKAQASLWQIDEAIGTFQGILALCQKKCKGDEPWLNWLRAVRRAMTQQDIKKEVDLWEDALALAPSQERRDATAKRHSETGERLWQSVLSKQARRQNKEARADLDFYEKHFCGSREPKAPKCQRIVSLRKDLAPLGGWKLGTLIGCIVGGVVAVGVGVGAYYGTRPAVPPGDAVPSRD